MTAAQLRYASAGLGRRSPARNVQTRRSIDVGRAEAWSFRWSFRQAQYRVTEPDQLDGLPDLTCKDSICQHAMDDPRLSSNP